MRYYIMNKDTKVLFFDIPDNSTDFNIVIMGVYNQALIKHSKVSYYWIWAKVIVFAIIAIK